MAKGKHENPPGIRKKCIFNKKRYIGYCFKLFSWAIVISALIFTLFYIQIHTYAIDNLKVAVTSIFSLLILYLLFMGCPINKESIVEKEHSKTYNHMFTLVYFIKNQILKSVINSEREHLKSCIEQKIKEWYDSDRDIDLGALIVRINGDFFNDILPKDTEQGIKELMKQNSLGILKLYDEKDSTLLDKLINLFDKELIEYGARLIDIANFINNHQYNKVTEVEIQRCIDENLKKDKVKITYKADDKYIYEALFKLNSTNP
ncbi:hypothetical protein FQB35_10310 [Crassaminicella thermophila]|uniref:Uncharacterized protein n=1 Tax=Crassaminicella thermophila TaxID=2599308 RepID=A0A5C0SEE2_CRATE|nr:hypothetical protein [Crassaminicella thermophila]QEK12691.1 hypothetical protein FQB35_10310 [Crassaminicella thermophila]